MKTKMIDKMLADLAPCVADIGARGGLDEDMLAIAQFCEVVGFEPDAVEAARLVASGDSRWRKTSILPYAVGGSTGPAILYVPESEQGASLLRHNPVMVDQYGYDNLHIDRRELPVTVVALDELRQNEELPRVDYLKIDIEGAELDVLRAGRQVLSDCVALKVECSFLEQRIGQPLIWDVVPYLLGEHFALVDIVDVHRWRRRNLPAHPYRIRFKMPYSRGQVSQCDLIFLRTPKSLANNRQGLRLVVLSAVLGFYDYAITVLRTRPDLNKLANQEYGFDLEEQLGVWSENVGRRSVRKAVVSNVRQLVPLLRSLTGRLPFAVPRRSY